MKASELHQLTLEELAQKEADFREELFNLRLQRVAGKLENPSRIGEVRKIIARIKTIMNEKRK